MSLASKLQESTTLEPIKAGNSHQDREKTAEPVSACTNNESSVKVTSSPTSQTVQSTGSALPSTNLSILASTLIEDTLHYRQNEACSLAGNSFLPMSENIVQKLFAANPLLAAVLVNCNTANLITQFSSSLSSMLVSLAQVAALEVPQDLAGTVYNLKQLLSNIISLSTTLISSLPTLVNPPTSQACILGSVFNHLPNSSTAIPLIAMTLLSSSGDKSAVTTVTSTNRSDGLKQSVSSIHPLIGGCQSSFEMCPQSSSPFLVGTLQTRQASCRAVNGNPARLTSPSRSMAQDCNPPGTEAASTTLDPVLISNGLRVTRRRILQLPPKPTLAPKMPKLEINLLKQNTVPSDQTTGIRAETCLAVEVEEVNFKPQQAGTTVDPLIGYPAATAIASTALTFVGPFGKRRHVCPVPGCKKMFPKRNKLREHICRHTGERPYACEQCSSTFVRTYDLRRHTLTHSRKRETFNSDPILKK